MPSNYFYSPIDPQAAQASASGANQAGNYYQVSNNAVWMRPDSGPGGNTSWMYGASSPTAGIDRRAWTNVANPLAYEYGGERGGAGQEQRRYASMGEAAMGRTGPQMDLGQFNQYMDSEGRSRDAQMRALDMAEASALGRGPSVAQAQLVAGQAQNARTALQLAASARGGGAAMAAAQQNALQQNQVANTQGNFQAGILRQQEMAQAQQAFSQQAVQMRAADLQRAGMSADMAYRQASLEQGQRAQNQQAQLAYEAMRQGVFQNQLQAQQAGEAQNAGTGLSQAQQAAARDAASAAFWRQLIGGTITAAGTVGGAMIGGPAGAVAGGAAGQAVGGAVANQAVGGSGGGASGRYMT